MAWDLEPGDRIKRTDLHGGRRQGGIAPSAQTANVMVFTDRSIGEQHGYLDRWEGLTLHYTGEGQRGDQQMIQGNRTILDHGEAARSLRVFEGASGTVMYLGEFTTDPTTAWYWDRAPETGGGPIRRVIMFRLVPVSEFVHGDRVIYGEEAQPTLEIPYREVDENPVTEEREASVVDSEVVDRGLRGHRVTQNALATSARQAGFEPISPGFGDPPFDVGWWDENTFVVVEVKSLTQGNEVGQLRLGLGQVLDYQDQIRRSGRPVRAVLAVEQEPSDLRWLELCSRHGVDLVWPSSWQAWLAGSGEQYI